MTRGLSLVLEDSPFERVVADLAVAGFFEDELPLRGGAGRADWRLCGLVSEQLAAGRLEGKRGEALLLPSEGRMRAPRTMLLGLGQRPRYRLPQVTESARAALLRGTALGVSSLAIVPLGLDSDDFPRCVEAFVRGAVDGISACDREIALHLVLAESDHPAVARALNEALRALDRPDVTIQRRIAPASPLGAATHARVQSPNSRR